MTQVGDRTADVFGSLPRGVELLSSSSPVPVAVPVRSQKTGLIGPLKMPDLFWIVLPCLPQVRKVGCVQGLAIKGQSAPLPCSNSTGSGLCGDGTNGSSSARLAVPTAARTRKGNTQVERFDENVTVATCTPQCSPCSCSAALGERLGRLATRMWQRLWLLPLVDQCLSNGSRSRRCSQYIRRVEKDHRMCQRNCTCGKRSRLNFQLKICLYHRAWVL